VLACGREAMEYDELASEINYLFAPDPDEERSPANGLNDRLEVLN